MPFDIYSKDGADEVFVRTVNSTGPDEAGNVVVSGGGAVDSVNGQTGEVVLDAADVGAAPAPTGTPDGTKFYRDDGTWATPAGGGGGSTLVVVGDTATPITDPNTARPTADWVLWYADGVHPVNALATDLIIRVDEDVFDGTVINSLEIVGGALQLVNDEDAPGANQVYGTDGSGVKGWKADPAGSDPRRHPGAAGGSYLSLPAPRGTHAGADGQCRLVPVYFPQAQTLTNLGCEVTTAAAGSTVRLGVYDDVNAVPANLLVDAGTVDASTVGTKAAGAFSISVGPGTVWIAVVTQGGGPALRTFTSLPHFTQFATTLQNALGATPMLGWYVSGVTGALPATIAPTQTLNPVWAVAWRVS